MDVDEEPSRARDSFEDDDDEEEEENFAPAKKSTKAPSKKAPAKKTTAAASKAKGKGKGKLVSLGIESLFRDASKGGEDETLITLSLVCRSGGAVRRRKRRGRVRSEQG